MGRHARHGAQRQLEVLAQLPAAKACTNERDAGRLIGEPAGQRIDVVRRRQYSHMIADADCSVAASITGQAFLFHIKAPDNAVVCDPAAA